MSEQQLDVVAQRFRVLSDPMRLKILHNLRDGELTVGSLVNATGASQPNISKHLSILRGAGLVNRRQDGNMAYFSIGAPFVFQLCDIVCEGIRKEFEQKQSTFR
ncbi:MAG: metalloregulator ArsR/SmtB family transcription factor [Pseudomonadota bacterium]|nr:transcriptional regulator [Pseudomonadales bacterium]MDY6920376.1 metalloregulator ArsR/SmtB family transcription factor [Pseudomonadota bacterium]|tara:strand:- start:75 stop:386 length:312 start_codon:yes stop_codon:yes gene_type:complete